MMRVFQVILLFFFIMLPCQQSYACGGFLSEDRVHIVIEKAYFIGKVKVIHIQDSLVTLQVIQPYKPFEEKVIQAHFMGSSCSKGFPKIGTIYEEMIFETEWPGFPPNTYYLSGHDQYLFKENWEEYRKTAPESVLLEKEISTCKKNGGEWREDRVGGKFGFFVFDCYFKASNYDKECNDNSQCDGYCVTSVTDKEQRGLSNYSGMVKKYEKMGQEVPYEWSIERAGKCTEWKNLNGCYNTVTNGTVNRRECFAIERF